MNKLKLQFCVCRLKVLCPCLLPLDTWMSFIPSCLNLSQPPCQSNYISRHIASNFRRLCIKRPQILSSAHDDAVGLRVFVLSDLHTDYAENMKWVKCLSTDRYKNDVLLVAGDVAETYDNFLLAMSLLKDRFEHVFYVPGNHDLWCRRDGEDNVRILFHCQTVFVDMSPND